MCVVQGSLKQVVCCFVVGFWLSLVLRSASDEKGLGEFKEIFFFFGKNRFSRELSTDFWKVSDWMHVCESVSR